MTISPQRRAEIIDALRRGTVPEQGLDALAVGVNRFAPAADEHFAACERGQGQFKAVRGEYGAGKTFTTRWLAERARRRGFVTSEVQISEGETPLHKLQTVYRRVCERLSTPDQHGGALKSVIDGWFFTLEEDVLAAGQVHEHDEAALIAATEKLAEQRLEQITQRAPMFSAALRGYRTADASGDTAAAEALLAWLGGQPNVGASAKRAAGIKGDLDHDGALAFLSGLLVLLRDSGHPGLVLVLDEVETLQRVRSDARDRALNALRQLIDEVDAKRFPGLFLVVTGTAGFFDGPQGVQRLPPLAQRLHTELGIDPKFDNPRDVQWRLPGFDLDALAEVGRRVRDLYAQGASPRIGEQVDDAYLNAFAAAVAGELGSKVGVAPRVFLKKLVAGVLDRVDQFEDFDPRTDYELAISDGELTEAERAARSAQSVDDIELDV